MKALVILLTTVYLVGCTYAQRVSTLDDNELCRNLGVYTLRDHKQGIALTRSEIQERSIDKGNCADVANEAANSHAPDYKLELCQQLAAYHYKGAYEHFKRTITRVESLGFADDECNTMADFYLTKLSRKQERSRAIGEALNQAAENMQRTNEQLYGRGSYWNPIHIKIQ